MQELQKNDRRSRPEVFFKKVVLKDFAKFTGDLFLIKVQA